MVEKSDLQHQIQLPKVPGQIWNMSRDRYPSFFAKCMRAGTKAERRGNSSPCRPARALLRTDNAAAHGRLTGIMNVLRAGEYLKVAFVALVAGRR
jgi:hypothetical protein